jgi:hypothetical protein
LTDGLAKRLELAERGPAAVGQTAIVTSDDERLVTRVRLILDHTEASSTMRAQKGLQIALELSGADDGFLIMRDSKGEPAAQVGSAAPDAALVSWAEERLRTSEGEETLIESFGSSTTSDHDKIVGRMHYCVVLLWADDRHMDSAIAAMALGFYDRHPNYPDRDVLRVIAGHLLDAARE